MKKKPNYLETRVMLYLLFERKAPIAPSANGNRTKEHISSPEKPETSKQELVVGVIIHQTFQLFVRRRNYNDISGDPRAIEFFPIFCEDPNCVKIAAHHSGRKNAILLVCMVLRIAKN